MLDTRFPRLKDDIGNSETFPFPVRKTLIKGAFPKTVVRDNPKALLPHFIEAAKNLEADGAFAITTSCGFLTLFQKELEEALTVPVLTSSLFLYDQLRQKLPVGKTVGILTIASSSLTAAHLKAAGIENSPPIGTTEGGKEFTAAILENREDLDIEKAQSDNVNAALKLQRNNPDLGCFLLECTNMPPYKEAIEQATGLPVYSILDGLNDLWNVKNKID